MRKTKLDVSYSSGTAYDRRTRYKLDDISFYYQQSRRSGGKILELACGTGRLTIPLAKAGIEIMGLDRSEEMLQTAKQKSAKENIQINWMTADCLDFSLHEKFNLIFLAYNSFCHFGTAAHVARLFKNVRRHLSDEGMFIFDIYNPSVSIINRDEDSAPEDLITLNRLGATGPNQSFRYYYPKEVQSLISSSGFSVRKHFGDFSRKAFLPDSRYQIFVCSPRGFC